MTVGGPICTRRFAQDYSEIKSLVQNIFSQNICVNYTYWESRLKNILEDQIMRGIKISITIKLTKADIEASIVHRDIAQRVRGWCSFDFIASLIIWYDIDLINVDQDDHEDQGRLTINQIIFQVIEGFLEKEKNRKGEKDNTNVPESGRRPCNS